MKSNLKKYYNKIYYREQLNQINRGCKVSMSQWAYEDGLTRLSFYLEMCPGQSLLDVGAGAGYCLKVAEDIGITAFGLDISEIALQYSRKLASKSPVVLGDAEQLPFKDGFFNAVSFIGTLEHFPNPEIALKEAIRVSEPNAKFLLLVPNSKYILHYFNYKTSTQPFDWQRDLNGWKKLLVDNGLKIDNIVANNKHLLNPRSSNMIKLLLKKIIKPFVKYLPIKLSYHFLFVCSIDN